MRAEPIARRTILKGAGLLGMGAGLGLTGLLSACGVAADDEEGSGRSGGTLTLAIDATSAMVDPAFYDSLGDWMAVDCICRGLTFISFEKNEPEADLAESWEISDDQRTYTFKLRQGVTFHDGTKFTSADVLASFNRQFDPNDKTLAKGAARPLEDLGANLASMTAPDEYTVVLVLKAPDATVLGQLSDIGGRIISKAALDKYGAEIGKHLVGTGPFTFASATSGQSVVLEAFDKFRLGKPPIDRLVLQQVQDPSTIVSSLISGDISATQFTPYSALEELGKNDAVTVYDTPKSFSALMFMDARRIPELAVRKAINLAINRQAIIAQAFFGAAALPEGYMIPPNLAGYDKSLADLSKTDVAEAKRLIASANAAGREIRLMAASDSWHPKAAQIIAQNLTDIGLTVVTDSVDPASYFNRLLDPADTFHELMIWERNSYVPNADNMVGAMAKPVGVYGDFITGFKSLSGSAVYADQVFAAKNIADAAKQAATYSDIQRRFAETFMVAAVLANATNPVVSGADVKDLNVNALANHRCFLEKASL